MKKIAILTTFQEVLPGYSLTGIVSDQIRMLKLKGHDVSVFVNEKFKQGAKFDIPVDIKKVIPFAHLHDYDSEGRIEPDHVITIQNTKKALIDNLQDVDIAITHDFVFTGWNLPYARGVVEAQNHLPKTKWLHWIHSVPSSFRDWWIADRYYGYGKIVFPNYTDRLRVAEQFRGKMDDVRVVHHIKDLRSWFDFSDETCEFIDTYPGVMQSDIVCVYPASCDRLNAKRVKMVIHTISELKRKGCSVCFVVANQWASQGLGIKKQSIKEYIDYAESLGLKNNSEFIFTSEFKYPKYDSGISKRMLRELLLCSNLFMFPTREESFGLVLPEAALCGNFVVSNKSLPMMNEITGGCSLSADFGSYNHNCTLKDPMRYFKDVASLILQRMNENECVKTRTYMRQHYNWDYLYERQYAPLFEESKLWRAV